MRPLTIAGARPQFIEAAATSRAIREVLLHTGQHYDENMSQVFFAELDIPRLFLRSRPHARRSMGRGRRQRNVSACWRRDSCG